MPSKNQRELSDAEFKSETNSEESSSKNKLFVAKSLLLAETAKNTSSVNGESGKGLKSKKKRDVPAEYFELETISEES